MNTIFRRLRSDRNTLGHSAVLLATAVLTLLALVLLISPTKPAAASCAGPTVVGDEAALSAAITALNAATGPCNFQIDLSADISLTANLPAITNTDPGVDLEFDGNGWTIDANGFAVFHEVNSAVELSIHHVTITEAFPSAISSNNELDLVESNLLGNDIGLELSGNGQAEITDSNIIGSMYFGLLNYGNLTLERSTVASSGLNGIFNFGALYVYNSTVNGNNGDGIYNPDNTVTVITSSTIADNMRYGIFQEVNTTLTVFNSIVAGNLAGECTFLGLGTYDIQYSLFQSGASCGVTDGVDNNIVGENAVLSPLTYIFGGWSLSRQLMDVTGSATATSPAVDVGNNSHSSLLTTDQRGDGFPRVVNSIIDMGSTEDPVDIECPPFPLFVVDEVDLNFAIACYNLQTSAQIYGIYLGDDIDLNLSTMPIDNPTPGVSLYINGQNFTLDGHGRAGTRLLQINADNNVVIDEIVLTGGNATGDGGAILNMGDLELIRVTVSDNTAVNGGGVFNTGDLDVELSVFDGNTTDGSGGGIVTGDTGETTITTTTFSNNIAQSGGGIFGAFGTLLDVTESTFNDNHASYAGGGIGVENLDDTAVVANSTFSGNSAVAIGGGIANSVSAMTVNNSTFVGNQAQEGGGISAGLTFCFTGDMLVQLADGGTKRMADVAVGDALLGYDFATGEQVAVTVQATMSREVDEFLRINDLEVTAEHPFAVGPDEWVQAKDLRLGDQIMSNGGWTTVNSIATVEKTAEVYNINVSDTHNFYVSDGTSSYLVHNKLMDITLSDVSLNNSIITDSIGGDCLSAGGVFSGSNNLLDDHAAGDCSSTSTAAVTNLNLTLLNNDGPTKTHALLAGSNAINGGNNTLATGPGASPLTTDQRGVARINNSTVDVGAYEFETTSSGGFCPVDENVGYELTDVIGTGQGSLTKGYRTRKLVVPNSDEVVALYGQLAALETGVMKYVRFLPQGEPKVQIHAPTSPAYRTFAVDWWGTDLPTDVQWVKGQFFWGAKGNKSPRAFVLWPTYETDEQYANVFTTFDESSENHVAWEPGFIQTQTQVVAIPETQAAGANITVKLALVDVNKDTRSVTVTVEAGGVTVGPQVITVPNQKDTLNLETFLLEGVAAGTDEVTITLESPDGTGDSAAMIGAAVSYACEGDPVAEPVAQDDFYQFAIFLDVNASAEVGLFADNGSGPDDLSTPAATLVSFGGGDLGGTASDNPAGTTVSFVGGSLTVNADGSWTLTGPPFDVGTHTFDYVIQNAGGQSTATVTLDFLNGCLLGDLDETADC